jgi:hypothetical protein
LKLEEFSMRKFLIVLLLLVPLVAQDTLTNDSVVKLVKAGLGEDIIVNMINTQPSKFSTSADSIVALKKAGVSDRVIAAMVSRPSGGAAAPAAPAAPMARPAEAAPMVSEIGVYIRKEGAWADLNPEVINFKTGGVIKSIGTAGIVKGDVNGHLNGAHSPNLVKTPLEFLIYTADGVAITEYQLLKLREQKDSREFRTMTGGVMHASGGATRDAMAFESKKLAPRTYQITLENLSPGDYGFLPPTGSDATGSSGRLGKLYSFRLLE